MNRTRPWRLLALPPLGEELLRIILAPLGDEVRLSLPATRDRAGLHAALADAELVIGDFTGQLALDGAAVAAAPHLAFVQMPSVGVDSCDLAALTRAGVPLANAAGANARAVAEWAVGAAFALCRRLAWADRRVRAGEWPQAALLAMNPREIHSQRVGVLGFGAVGAETARLLGLLGCSVSYWSRTPRRGVDATYRELDDLLSCSDLLVVALPLTDETAGLLGPGRLALLPAGALLVNVARGGIVDEAALCSALDEGRLAGAALDVFDEEPPPVDSPLRAQENVLLSPHAAGGTGQAQINIVTLTVKNITAVVAGHPVRDVVNPISPIIHRR